MPQDKSKSSDQGPDLSSLIPELDLLPYEDPAAYKSLLEALVIELAPVTIQENALAQEIVDCHWQHFRDKRLTRDLDDAGFRQAACTLHLEKKDAIHPSQADKDLHEAVHSSNLDTLQDALATLEAQGISQTAIRVRAYLDHFKETETLGRRTGRNDDRRRALRQEYADLVSVRHLNTDGTPGADSNDNA